MSVRFRIMLRIAALLCAILFFPGVQASLRVIALAPHATEIAFAAGLGGNLIAVSAASDYPPEAARLEQVASWQGINTERILALKPDLVLGWRGGNPQRSLEQLSRFGIKIVYLDPLSLNDVASLIDELSDFSDNPRQGKAIATALRNDITLLQQTYARNGKKRIFLQFGTVPLFTASGHTLQSEVLKLCGGENVFQDSPVPWPQVNREQVLLRKPDAVLVAGGEKQAEQVKQFWGKQLTVPVISVPEDWFNRPGPRMLKAAQSVCAQLNN